MGFQIEMTLTAIPSANGSRNGSKILHLIPKSTKLHDLSDIFLFRNFLPPSIKEGTEILNQKTLIPSGFRSFS